MNRIFNKLREWKAWMYAHPKKTYRYIMIILIALFVANVILDIYKYKNAPKDPITIFPIVELSELSENQQPSLEDKVKEEAVQVEQEFNSYREKMQQGTLTKNDSLRIEFLYQKLQILKNGTAQKED